MHDFIINDAVDIVDDCKDEVRSRCSNKDAHKRRKFYIFILIYCFIAASLIILYNMRTSHILAGATVNYINPTNKPDINTATTAEHINLYININTANIEELMALNGIGEELAGRIVSYREEFGLFKSIEDIKNVKGIGEKLFDKIKLFIYVDYIPDTNSNSNSNSATYPSSIPIVTDTTTVRKISFPIDINTATVDELTQLKGIGEVIASRIIDYRENVAPFGDESDIMNVSGIGEATYRNIKGYIFVSNKYRTTPTTATTTTQKASLPRNKDESATTATTTTIPRIGSIEINTATYSQLMTIPDMTEEIANGILHHVENAFFFNNVYELLLIPEVGNEKFNLISKYFYVDTKYAEEFKKQQEMNDILDRESQQH